MIGGREAVFRQAEDGNDLVGESKVPRVRRDHLRRGGATASTQLRFTSEPASDEFSRWFIDDICVTK